MRFPPSLPIPEEVMAIARRLEQAGYEAWCVGGAIRDALLGDPHADYDIATSATPDEVRRLFRRTAPVGIKYGTVGVLDSKRGIHEVTTFRRDVETDGRHAVVAYGVALEEDLARRDFTINAIAYHPLRHLWRDPFRGADDLERGLIRAVGDPAQRFREDYLRILRAVRFAGRFGFAIEPATWAAAQGAASGLRHLSAERVHDEWYKGLRSARDVRAFARLWREVGAADIWLPELDPAVLQDPAGSASEPLPTRDPVVLTVWLCTDPLAALRRFKSSNADLARAAGMVQGPPEPGGTGEAAVRRWLAAVGDAAGDLQMLWTLRHGGAPPWSETVRRIRERGDPLTRADLAIGGAELVELGASGPRVGEILTALLDRVLEEPALNTRESLLALARDIR